MEHMESFVINGRKYTPRATAEQILAKKRVTQSDIADFIGCSLISVSFVLSGNAGRVGLSPEFCNQVMLAAKMLGYKGRLERAAETTQERELNFRLRHNNCKTIDEENRFMKTFRSMGYSNAEIAKKMGYDRKTIRNRIGSQPEDLSLHNRKEAQRLKAAKNRSRKEYLDTHLVTEYNGLILECANLRSQASELIAKSDLIVQKVKELEPKVKKATLSKVKPSQLPEPVPVSVPAPVADVIQ